MPFEISINHSYIILLSANCLVIKKNGSLNCLNLFE